MSRRSIVAVTVLVLLVGLVPSAAVARSAPASTYLVRLAGEPAVAYEGGTAGLRATAPQAGQKIDPAATHVARYVGYLADRHNQVLASVGAAGPLYSYTYAFNGFAARLTVAQARRLAAQSGVVSVTPDHRRKLDTVTTPAFLGLTGPSGAWADPGIGGVANAGEGMVIGIIDSGIWPESASFAANGGNGKTGRDGGYAKLKDWKGRCQGGEAFPSTVCNQKLVGARYFNEGWAGFYANLPQNAGRKYSGRQVIDILFPFEYISARDADGHGTHTASTAAGNNGVDAVVDGVSLGRISGMAPRARIAAYKVCWGADEGGCYNADSVAAIDAAVADGVDALNFSISGARSTIADPVEIAFYYAARAGIVISASAGNSGPDESTVAHNSPWLMTTAAGTHDRSYTATVTLGNSVSYTGAGLGAAVTSHPVVTSGDVAVAGADPVKVRRCYDASDNGGVAVLDPAKATGKIVVCDRGTTNRTSKSLAVKNAGGVGMILVNTSPNSLNADFHYVPTVHLPDTDRAAIYAYASGGAGTASFTAGSGTIGAQAPDVASFSSRGPALSGGSNLLKPDIMAPGVDILAAVSPAGYGRDFDFLSGTSMSSPHMTGIMTLVKQAHPSWSPAAVKSALMTTASTMRNDDTPIPGGPFAYGAGQVVPKRALDPGLVYDAGSGDWIAFLCATEPGLVGASTCSTLASIGYSVTDASQMNYPSIAVSSLTGTKTVTRRVKNVSGATETYDVAVSVPGFDATSSKTSFTLGAGDSTSFTLTFTRDTADFNEFASGELVLTSRSNANHVVTSPVVLRPVAVAAPREVAIDASGGSYTVRFGYTGSFTTTTYGPIAAETTAGMVADDPDNEFVAGGAGQVAYEVTIAPGTSVARFQLFDADVNPGSDLDLFVYFDDEEVGSSENGASNEVVTLRDPDPGTYTVYVHGWETAGRAPSPFVLYRWLLGETSSGLLDVAAPASATANTNGTITLTTSGLAAGRRYLGAIAYDGSPGMPVPTIVRFDTPAAP